MVRWQIAAQNSTAIDSIQSLRADNAGWNRKLCWRGPFDSVAHYRPEPSSSCGFVKRENQKLWLLKQSDVISAHLFGVKLHSDVVKRKRRVSPLGGVSRSKISDTNLIE